MRHLIFLLSFTLLGGCSYSPDTLKQSYKSLANDYVNELKQIVPMSSKQEAILDKFGTHLQHWHQTEQLPFYSNTFKELATVLENDKEIHNADIYKFIQFLHGYPHFHLADNSNLILADLAISLSDQQAIELHDSISEQTEDIAAKFRAMSEQQFWREQSRGINDIFKYLGVTLSNEQLQIIERHNVNYHDQREDIITGLELWNDQLHKLIEMRQNENFRQQFVMLMRNDNEYIQLQQIAPQQTAENDQYLVAMLQELLSSLNDTQRKQLQTNFKSIGDTFQELI